jgi:rhodanese-related sulfurtransferase
MTKRASRRASVRRAVPLGPWAAIAGAVVLLVAAVFVWRTRTAGPASGYPLEVSVPEAAALRDSGAFILDVREQHEWDEYHVPGSTLIPLAFLESRLAELPSDAEIVVVCRSGNRSATGRDILLDAGFERVTSLSGGLSQWRASGYPTVTGP